MHVKTFIYTWIYPVIFVPWRFIQVVIMKLILRRDTEVLRAIRLDLFQAAFNERMRSRKTELLTETMTRVKQQLGRPIRVLEVGSGSGANFGYYPPSTSIVCIDPNPNFEASLWKNAKKCEDVTLESFHVCYGEDMKEFVQDSSVDVVVSTLTLCSVQDVDKCLKEFLRVLRPVGPIVAIISIHDVISWG